MTTKHEIELKKREPDDAARYLIGKYLTGEITLMFFKMLIDLIKLPYTQGTDTGK